MRLIDADAAIDAVEFECGEWRGLARTIVKAIKQLPTIEQPKIIHCKNCKKHHLGFGFCPMVHHSAENPLMVYELNDDDDFCSRAERVGT